MADDDYEYVDETSIDPGLICSICRSPFDNPYSTPCKHIYCRVCINHCLQSDPSSRCSICRRRIESTDLTRADAICDRINQLLVTCKRCEVSVQRGQFEEHKRNHCLESQSFSHHRMKLLLNTSLMQCQRLREELEHQRTEMNNNSNRSNNSMNTVHEKMKKQQDEIEFLRKLTATQQRKIQELEGDLQMREEKVVDELENYDRQLQNRIKHFHDESDIRFDNLEEKINQLLPYSNEELEDYITKNCDFSSQFAFRDADLTDRDIKIIVKRVIINRQCTGLNLRKNQITSQGASFIADVFHRNIRLRILDLSYNRISDSGTLYLVEALLENTTLKELHLGSNQITNQGIKYFVEMLQLNETLKKLYLFENDFDDDGLKLLTDVLLKDNRTLVELSVRGNLLITDRSVYPIIDMLKGNRTLDRVEIDQCDFSNGAKTRLRDAADNASITIDI